MAMAPKKYTWIALWFICTAPLILWDASYVLMRPRSMEGGDLRWFWRGFELYERIDNVYSVQGYHNKAGFAPAAAISNLVETSLNAAYLYTVYISPRNIAPLFGFSGAGLTLSKTTIWVLQEHFCGRCSHSDNPNFAEIFKFWIAPNVVWFLFCSLIVVTLGRDIVASLNTTPIHEAGRKAGSNLSSQVNLKPKANEPLTFQAHHPNDVGENVASSKGKVSTTKSSRPTTPSKLR